MAVTAQTPFSQFTAAPGATVFSSEFRVLQASDLVVKVNGAVIASGFSVSGIGAAGGVDVTFSTPMTGGEVVELLRDIPLTRATDYQQLGDFLAPVVNLDFDRLWMSQQDQESKIGSSLRLPFPEQVQELPAVADRIRKLFYFDKTGAPVMFSGTPGTVLGFNSSGDAVAVVPASGSAADLALELASTASGNGAAMVAFKQSGTGAVDRTAAGKLHETRTPADFASMQDFLNASASASAVFIVPPGTYTVTSTLKVPSDSRIHWTRGAVLMAANGLNADVLQNSNTSGGNSGISWTGHCRIDGNYLNQTGGNGITFDKVTDSDFGILEANNCKGHGILWSECNRNIVQDIRASRNGKTLAAYGAYLYNSSDNEVKRASVADNCIGIAIEASGAGKTATRNTISSVKARNNRADYSQSGAGVHFEESAGGYAGDNVVIYPDCRNSTGVGINLTDVDNIRLVEPVLRDNGKSGLTALQSLNIQIIGGEAIGNATAEGAGYRAQLRFDDSGLTGCTGTVIGLKASGSEEGVKTFSSGCAMRFVSCDLAGTVAKYNLNGAGDNVAGLDANGYSIDAKKPVMKAGKTTGQASAGVIVCNSELIDTRGMYDTATGVLKIPTAGVYMFSALATDGGGARLVIQLRKNGAVFAEATNVGGAATESSAAIPATFIQANAGDTVDLYLAAGTTVGGAEKTYIAAVHVA